MAARASQYLVAMHTTNNIVLTQLELGLATQNTWRGG